MVLFFRFGLVVRMIFCIVLLVRWVISCVMWRLFGLMLVMGLIVLLSMW